MKIIMKKITAIMLAAAIALALYGCFGRGGTDDSSDNTSAQTEVTDVKTEIYSVEVRREKTSAETYDAELTYPVIDGYSDGEIEEKINALVRAYIDKRVLEAVSGASAENRAHFKTVSFDVTCRGDRFFSALIHASIAYDSSDISEENLSFGINADLAQARLVSFGEIADFEKFAADFRLGAYTPTAGSENILDDTNYEDLLVQYGELYSIYPEFYLKSGADSGYFGVIFETVDLLGGYAEFEAPIGDKSYLNREFLEDAGLLKPESEN